MKFILKLIGLLALNALALFLAARWVQGFIIHDGITTFLFLALLLTALHTFLRPILKLLLSPIILITLGVALIAINMVILKLLDIFASSLSIEGTTSLFFATLIISLTNFFFHVLFRNT